MDHLSPEVLDQLQRALEPQYRLTGELGRGGMGVVFRGVDTTLDRAVAVKVIHPELATHPSIARRFLAEARMIARLRHPNVVAVYSAGSAGGLLYYVMDAVPGESLRERLARDGRLPADEAQRIVADLAAALDAAAAAGIVHRDLKPENILLERTTGRALLADFGIARAVSSDSISTTGQGVAVGTPAYMSPEQAAGEEVDQRSDLYALGIVGYEMLTGQPPFTGPNRVVVSKHIAEAPVPLAKARPDCPAPLAGAIMRALAKSPATRWQSGGAMRDALLAKAPAEPVIPRRRMARWAGAAVAAVLVAVGGVAVMGRSDRPPRGVNPRHSLLVLPFDNLRREPAVDWLREGSVSMLALNLSQWNDLQVVDHERLHDLFARHRVPMDRPVGLDMARRLARDAGVWTVVLGDYDRVGDSLRLTARVFDVASGARVDQAAVADRAGEDVRPLFDQLAAKLLDLSGAPRERRAGLAQATTGSLEAFRRYLSGVEALNRWDLSGAERELSAAAAIDTTFGLAYYKLALTRGWLVGPTDSIADAAMVRAVANAAPLPAHERALIAAYGAFLRRDFTEARTRYTQLLQRDSTDADAWYGLGEAWFHQDASWPGIAAHWSQALRAFKRALSLDPDYALAYDHVAFMLTSASRPGYGLALLPSDSFAVARAEDGRQLIDSTARAAAARRAGGEAVRIARSWVAAQPTTLRAHEALVDAYMGTREFDAALDEVGRFGSVSPRHPEQPFVEARIQFAMGQADRAAQTLRHALDSISPEDFRPYASTPTVLHDLASAANVFAYLGDVSDAAKAIDFVSRVRQAVYPGLGGVGAMDQPTYEHWRQQSLGELYNAVGGPPAALRRVWESAAEAGRAAAPERRKKIAYSGANAAIGLLTVSDDTTAVNELRVLTGEPPSKEVRALVALSRQDSVTARRALSEPDSTGSMGMGYPYYRRPLAAQAHYLLGDYQQALRILDDFKPENLATGGFDMRWGFIGRVRLLRAQLYEATGRTAQARDEYRAALVQWRSADEALEPFIHQAEQGLARLGAG